MNESVKSWRPNSKKQELFLSLPDDIFEALYGGAAGPGKSEILMMLPLAREFTQYTRFKGIFFRRTYPELEREIIPRSREYYSAAGGSYNDQKKVWEFPSGARIFFGHLEHEDDVRKYDTAEFNYEAFDELTSFTKYQYLYLSASRCRTSSNLPAIVRSATNPGNVGHQWVKDHFKIGSIPSGIVQRDKITGNLRYFLQAFLTDNPAIDPNYSARLELLPDAEKRAKKYGDWNLFEGQVFSEFRLSPLPDEPGNAQHVIGRIDIPDWWPKILAIDWGYAAFSYALWGAVSPNGRCYLYREYATKKEYIERWIADVVHHCQSENIVDVVIDPSSKQHRGQPKTIFQQISEALPENLTALLRSSDNDRVGGKLLVHEFMRWKPKRHVRIIEDEEGRSYDAEFAQKVLRIGGQEKYDQYLAYFREEPQEDPALLPKLQIFDNLKLLIETIPQCVYDRTHPEDVEGFDGDDPYDTLRYLLKAVHSYVSVSAEESERRDKLNSIITDFERTQDYHALHMRMLKLESGGPDKAQPRYGKRRLNRCPTLVQG